MYIGELKNDNWNGYGTFISTSGEKFFGHFIDNKWDGTYTIITDNEDKYIRTVEDGTFTNPMYRITAKGEVIKGECRIVFTDDNIGEHFSDTFVPTEDFHFQLIDWEHPDKLINFKEVEKFRKIMQISMDSLSKLFNVSRMTYHSWIQSTPIRKSNKEFVIHRLTQLYRIYREGWLKDPEVFLLTENKKLDTLLKRIEHLDD